AALLPEIELVEERVDALFARGVVDLVAAPEEVEVVDRRHLIVEREVVRQIADAPPRALGVARDVDAVDADGPARRQLQRCQHAQRRGLARAVRPLFFYYAARRHREAERADGVAHAVIRERHVFDPYHHRLDDTGGAAASFLDGRQALAADAIRELREIRGLLGEIRDRRAADGRCERRCEALREF